MNFYQLGQKKNPALIILHGWGLDGSTYHKLAELLANDFFVLVPDLPGFGKTRAPQKPYDVLEYAKRVKKFMKLQKIDEAFIVGHSFGGRVTVKLVPSGPPSKKSLMLLKDQFPPLNVLENTSQR